MRQVLAPVFVIAALLVAPASATASVSFGRCDGQREVIRPYTDIRHADGGSVGLARQLPDQGLLAERSVSRHQALSATTARGARELDMEARKANDRSLG